MNLLLSILAALALAALSAYVVIKRKTAAARLLSAAFLLLAFQECCESLALYSSANAGILRQAAQILEALVPGLFLFAGLTHARKTSFADLSWQRIGITASLAVLPLVILVWVAGDLSYAPDLQGEAVLFLESSGYWFYFFLMTAYIAALVRLESTFSATAGNDRYRFKYEALGIMIMLAVMIFYYSQGLLYRTIDLNLIPIRSGVIVIGAMLTGFSVIVRGNGVRVVVSRHLFYRSIALIVIGVYLVSLSILQHGLNYIDDSAGRYVGVFLAFAGGILLLVLLLSEELRRRVKVLISKHFFAQKHDYRHAWMALTDRLVTCTTPGAMKQGILDAYCEMFGLANASLYVIDRANGRFVPAVQGGLPLVENGFVMSEDLLSYFLERNRVWNTADDEYHPAEEEKSFAAVTGAKFVVPLICNRRVEAVVLFGRQLAPEQFTFEDYDLMKVMARQSALVLSNLNLSDELIETREFAAVARVSSFVVHDLKNLTYSLSLVMDNAEEHIGNDDFQRDMLSTVRNILDNMKNLIQRLKAIPGKSGVNREDHDLSRLSATVVAELKKTRPRAHILHNGQSVLSRVDGEEIKKVITNLIQNGIDASDDGGTIIVETGISKGRAYCRVTDTGAGMTEDFIENHLFKPFRTTKTKGLGIGLYHCKQIVEAHSGTLAVKSGAGKGTVFTVYLPAAGACPAPAPQA